MFHASLKIFCDGNGKGKKFFYPKKINFHMFILYLY